MRQFTKQPGCPAAATLVAYHEDALPVLSRQAVGAHLSNCEFCAAEAQLLGRADQQPAAEFVAPPMPFALRALAESMLGGIPRTDDLHRRAA
ncbi:MAG TPA: hypothetical protein VF525_15925 [Pyrinomonadaceae bacterium]|jgi:hypothetical protein